MYVLRFVRGVRGVSSSPAAVFLFCCFFHARPPLDRWCWQTFTHMMFQLRNTLFAALVIMLAVDVPSGVQLQIIWLQKYLC